MKLGCAFSNLEFGTDFGAIRDVVQALDANGFAALSVNDHVVGGHPDRAGGEKGNAGLDAADAAIVMVNLLADSR